MAKASTKASSARATAAGAPVSLELRKRYFNRCNPDKPLDPTDEKYVEIHELEARGIAVIDELAERIELSSEPTSALFTGLPGSGKSTELRRLAARLSDPKGANLLPVLIDGDEVLDLYTTIDVPDVLMAVLYKTEVEVLEAEGKKAEGALQESRASRFWHWLTETEVGLQGVELNAGAELGVPGWSKASAGAKLLMSMKTSDSLRKQVREKLASKMTAFSARVGEAMSELQERAKKRKRAGIVVLFDSLEKLRGNSSTWPDVLKSAEDIFRNGAPNLRLPVHTLYTMPAALTYRVNIEVAVLPMLKMTERDGTPCDEGVAAALEIIHKRVPEEHLRELLGPTSAKDRVKRLLAWSGGYPREIVRLLRLCVQKPQLDEHLFKQLLATAGDQLCRMVPESAYPWLAKVHATKNVVAGVNDDRLMIDDLLQNNIVLRYHNTEPWFDVHPAVREMSGVADAIKERSEAQKTRGAPKG